MAYVFGNSFNDVASQRNFYDNLNLRVAENAQAEADKGAADQMESNRFNARQSQEDQRQANQQQYQFYQSQQSAADRAQERAQQQYQFGATEADKAAARGDEAARFNTNLQLSKDQLAVQQAQNKIANDFAQAQSMVRRGHYDDSPDDIVKDFPTLAPQQYAALNSLWDQKNKKQLSIFSKAQGEAEAATQLAQAPGWLDKNRFRMASQGLRPVVTPNSTNVVPVMPQPYQRPAPGVSPGAPPSNIASVPPPVAPGAPAPYNFAGGTAPLPDRGQVVAPAANAAQTPHTRDNPATVATQADYDSLQSGDWYVRPDGALARKK
jgi:hypothetical protein